MGKSCHSIPLKMWLVALLVCLPAFLYGYVTASLNAAMAGGHDNNPGRCFDDANNEEEPSCPPGVIFNDIFLTTSSSQKVSSSLHVLVEAQLATSMIVVGGWMGSLAGGSFSDIYGRRSVTLANNWFFIIGAGMCSVPNKWVLCVGRFVTGVGVGVECVVVPVLLAEIATEDARGSITTAHQLCLTAGIFFVGMLGYALVSFVAHGWIYIQVGSAIPATVMLLLSSYVPESPKWLIQENRSGEARAVLMYLRQSSDDVDKELRESSLQAEEESLCQGNGGGVATWAEVLACRRQLLVGVGLGVIASATGVNSIIFYSTQVFSFAGFHEPVLATASVGAVNLLATGLATCLVDVLGRKQLLLGGTSLMTVALLALALALLATGLSEQAQGALAVAAVLVYVAGFAIGVGAVMWVVMCEVMDQRVRSKAFGLFISINWGINLLIGLLTLSAIDELGGVKRGMTDEDKAVAEKKGVAWLFVVFGALCLLSQIFIVLIVPETKGRSPSDFSSIREIAMCDTRNSLNDCRDTDTLSDTHSYSDNSYDDDESGSGGASSTLPLLP